MASVRRVVLGLTVGVLIFGLGIDCATSVNRIKSEVGVSVRPTKLWRFLNKNDEMVLQRFRETIEEFSVGDIRCLRYCIESKTSMDEMPSILNFIWKLENKSGIGSNSVFDKDFKPEIIQGESIKSYDSNDTQSKCTFSIVIGCELSKDNGNNLDEVEKRFIKSLQPNVDIIEDSDDKSSPALNFLREKIVDKVDMVNETEVSFHVQANQAEMSIVVFGNITKMDLKIPIAPLKITSSSITTTEKLPATTGPRLTLATTRMPGGASGVRLNIINPPPGGWRLKIQGESDQTYRLVIVQTVVPEFSNPTTFSDFGEPFPLDNVDMKSMQKESGISSRKIQILDDVEDMGEMRMSDDSENKHALLPRMMSDNESSDEQKDPKSLKFPAEENKIAFDLNNNISTRMDVVDLGESRTIDRKSIDLADLSNPLNEELPFRKYTDVELSPRTELAAHPGSYHRLTFDITNNLMLKTRHYLFATSNPFFIYHFPQVVEIAPGQTFSVPVDIIVPPNVVDTVNKVTLRVQGAETTEKSANFYVRTSSARAYDDRRPDIDYYFNNNCHGKTSGENCLKSFWSVDIVIQDIDSGLKTVTSLPKGIYARTPYISGTSSPVRFYYTNNCCNREVEISAMDASGNVYSRTIDVDVWTNLSTGEILAIIFIALFIILLIVLIVLLVIYCIKRRRSHDLPYSQRYGSRSSPQ